MNLYQAEDFIKKMNPGKEVQREFDKNCLWEIDVMFIDGKLNTAHHMEFRKVKFIIDGNPIYVDIGPHRETVPFEEASKYLN